ncbi:ABC transporter ATP-binding protein [Virgibacillus kimchii]
MSFIQLKNITKNFHRKGQPAVNNLNLNIEQGEIVTLLGPSGCGKTTTLRMVAGFEQPDSGKIKIDDLTVFDNYKSVPPEKRGIGMVFQDYTLFPHMTIEKNVSFGLSKWRRKDRKQRTEEVLELVGLADYAHRFPSELSGGQQQRVALARAMAPKPHVILMDEPFSNLDAGLREKMRFDVSNILKQANTTAIIVTHDQKDAFSISDRVVVMSNGIVQQVDEPRRMYRCPRNCFVAQFVGKTNLLPGKLCPDMMHVDTHIGRVSLPERTEQLLEEVHVSIRPEGCRLTEQGQYSGKVERVTYGGDYQELEISLPANPLVNEPMIIYAPVEKEVEIGSIVSFEITPELVALVEN